MTTASELLSTLNKTLKQEGTATLGNDAGLAGRFWRTGILPLDAVLDGGFAKGRMALLAGESATLKSMVGLATAGQVQRQGGTAALIDTEHAYNPEWAVKLGVDPAELIVSRPGTAELAIDEIEVLIRNGIDYICVDSIPALVPRSYRDIQFSGKDNPQPARIAALLSMALPKLTAANEKTTVVWISQMRDNIGAMAFAPKTGVTGGKAIHYYVSQSVMLRKVGKISEDIKYFDGDKDATDKMIIGQKFKAELSKSRTGRPFRTQYFNYSLEHGEIADAGYLIQQGLDMGIITRPSTVMWQLNIADENGVVLNEEKFKGKGAFREAVETDLDIFNALNYAVANRYNLDADVYARLVAKDATEVLALDDEGE